MMMVKRNDDNHNADHHPILPWSPPTICSAFFGAQQRKYYMISSKNDFLGNDNLQTVDRRPALTGRDLLRID